MDTGGSPEKVKEIRKEYESEMQGNTDPMVLQPLKCLADLWIEGWVLSSQENNAGQGVWLWKTLFSITVQTQPPANVKIDTLGKDNLWKLH